MKFDSELAMELLNGALHVTTDEISADDTPSIAARKSLKKSFFKKWLPGDSREQDLKAVKLFETCNQRCLEFGAKQNFEERRVFVLARNLLSTYFHSGDLQSSLLDIDRCLDRGRAGPGASRGTKFTDFYNKMFVGNLSTDCLELYGHYTSRLSPRWSLAEKLRSSDSMVSLVRGSKLSCVPKNRDISRTIATEPSLNMFYQLGAGAIIEDVLSRFFGIKLDRQPFVNRWYARQGSIDGSFATIDLSSASDTISTALVQFLLPPDVFSVLQLIRSKYIDINGRQQELHMFSSMGNGFTFPLQTLIFATLIRATLILEGLPTRCRLKTSGKSVPTFSVFGDDIICAREAYDKVCSMLEEAGFIVNLSKSYNDGPFRESCGSDYFHGENIRGVYLRSMKHAGELYSAFNRLARWSLYHDCDISNLLLYLKGLASFRPVPFDESDDAGFKVPHSLLKSPKRRGCVTWYRANITRPRKRRVIFDDFVKNPDGAIISAIGGFITGQHVTVRSTAVRSQVVVRKTPSWDFLPYPGLNVRDYEFLWLSLHLLSTDGT